MAYRTPMYSGRVGVDDNFTMMPKITFSDDTKLLCHFDTDGTDSSFYNRTPTNLNASISLTQSKFGGGSLHMPTLGTHSYSYPYSTDFTIGTNDFTIEAWINIGDPLGYILTPIYSKTAQAFEIQNSKILFSGSGIV